MVESGKQWSKLSWLLDYLFCSNWRNESSECLFENCSHLLFLSDSPASFGYQSIESHPAKQRRDDYNVTAITNKADVYKLEFSGRPEIRIECMSISNKFSLFKNPVARETLDKWVNHIVIGWMSFPILVQNDTADLIRLRTKMKDFGKQVARPHLAIGECVKNTFLCRHGLFSTQSSHNDERTIQGVATCAKPTRQIQRKHETIQQLVWSKVKRYIGICPLYPDRWSLSPERIQWKGTSGSVLSSKLRL